MHKKIPQNSFTVYIQGQENFVPVELLKKTNPSLSEGDFSKNLVSSLAFRIQNSSQNENFVCCSIIIQTPNKSDIYDSPNILLAIQPENELKKLKDELHNFLDNQGIKTYRFEPTEPSFELNFEKTNDNGIKLILWVDSTNAHFGIYSWDAVGFRLLTNTELLKSFISQLDSLV